MAYGITSLPAPDAEAARLLAVGRGHGRIENGLQYRRAVTLQEDACQVRRGQAPPGLAALNNLVCTLWACEDRQSGGIAADLCPSDRSVARSAADVRPAPVGGTNLALHERQSPPLRTL